MQYTIIAISLGAIGLVAFFMALAARYKRCPSDKLLVIYGRVGKKNGDTSTAKCIHGGAAFIWPVIQDYSFMDLKPIAININLQGALSKQNIRVNVPSNFTVAISTEEGTMINAAERLLGLDENHITQLAKEIIFGQMRLVVAQMDVEEINKDREKFLKNINESIEGELKKIGLKLINVNITDIQDESGYIDALGKEAAADVINKAKVSVAEKNRDGAIGESKANQEKSIAVAQQNTTSEIGVAEAIKEKEIKIAETKAESEVGKANASAKTEIGQNEAESLKRVKSAEFNATAIEGENKSAIQIANTTADRQVKEAEAKKKTVVAQKVNAAKALEESYIAEEIAEKQRAKKDEASLYANIVVPQEIEKKKIEVAADAEANRERKIAQGKADAMFASMEAEAKGNYERLSKQAEGIKKIVDAAGGDPDKAVQLLIADKLEDLVKIQVEAIKNIKIDKIVVWDQGNGNGASSTNNFLRSMLTAVPGFEEVYKMAGKELPALLQGAGEKMKNEMEAKTAIESKKEQVSITDESKKKK